MAVGLAAGACRSGGGDANHGAPPTQVPTPSGPAPVAVAAPTATAPPDAAAPVDPLAPLPTATAAALAALPADPPPDALVRNAHYWVGNEHTLTMFHPDVADRGGGLLGVGTDQNYLLAGWQRAAFVVVIDFDEAIIDLHRAYLACFETAATPAEFLALWAPENRKATAALVAARWADAPELARIEKAFGRAADNVYARLRTLVRKLDASIPTFLTDAAQYAHVRTLVQRGRVFAVRGDYTKDATLLGLARALTDAGLDLSVIYLSNIEQYFDFVPGYRRNLLALPVATDAIVVRTLSWPSMGVPAHDTYHYNVQPAANFAAWLRTSRVKNLPTMLRRRTKTDVVGFSRMDVAPPADKRPPAIAAMP